LGRERKLERGRFGAATVFAALTLLVVAGAQAAPRDLPGWEQARWGMTMDQLAHAFGPRLRKLGTAIYFSDSFVIQVIDDVRLGGERFTALFQMDPGRGRLMQVLLRFTGGTPNYASYAKVRAALEAELGPPAEKTRETDSKSDRPWFRVTDRWVFPTTSVVLAYFEPNLNGNRDKSLTVRYFPTRETEPDQ
jgi:hypothetical protein